MHDRAAGAATAEQETVRAVIRSPVGPLVAAERDGALVELGFLGSDEAAVTDASRGGGGVLEALGAQLGEYFAGERREFELRLAPEGTEFQLAVWAALREIPYGETASYGDVACAVGRPRAVRVVGGANNANPISIVVPCHRVIGADGGLTGYGGGLEVKEALLELERSGARRPLVRG